jgi:hypothetical protein
MEYKEQRRGDVQKMRENEAVEDFFSSINLYIDHFLVMLYSYYALCLTM